MAAAGTGDSRVPFRICIIEDIQWHREIAEQFATRTFDQSSYAEVLRLEMDSPQTYEELLKVHLGRIEAGYYHVVLVDNELGCYPDFSSQAEQKKGIELIAAIVEKVALSTCFILNSSDNNLLLEARPELARIFGCIPQEGKNRKEVFLKIEAVFNRVAMQACPGVGRPEE